MISLETYCERVGMSPELVKSKARRMEVAYVRQTYIWYLRQKGLTFAKTGAAVNMDNATAIHSVGLVDYRLCTKEPKTVWLAGLLGIDDSNKLELEKVLYDILFNSHILPYLSKGSQAGMVEDGIKFKHQDKWYKISIAEV